ncbi:MAG: iduronate-2-sulfatase, partial [Pirellulaceae bacterium]
NLQGQSLAPILADPGLPGRGWALSQVARGPRTKRTFGFTLRTPRWRYTEWDQGRQGRELYDHENDPLEQNNLAEDSAQSKRVAAWSAQIQATAAATLPESGEIPPLRERTWAPNLTHP